MTDRGLLELAAKAADITLEVFPDGTAYRHGHIKRWNPLTDDGDALRLAVNLGLILDCKSLGALGNEKAGNQGEWFGGCSHDPHIGGCDSDDKNAAMRLAIVRAAAANGEAK